MRRGRRLLASLMLVVVAAFLLAAPFGFKPYGIFILSMWAVMTIAAIGLNLTLGYAGQVSLAQAAFVGIGAYITALLTTKGWPFWSTYLLGGVSCFAIGWLLGYPALRVQHHYLAFVTLAFNTLVYLIFRNEEWLTGGIYGISNVPRPDVAGWPMNGPREFYYFCLAHLALVSLATWWLIRSPWGRAFVALRDGEQLTAEELRAHVKSNLARYKVPRDVEFVDALPRNPTGKVLKRELENRAAL